MSAIEQRARMLLATLIKIRDSTFRDAASLRCIADMAINSDRSGDFHVAAINPPEGYVLVPVDPTQAMLDAMYTSLDLDGKVLKKMWGNALAASQEAP